MKKIEKYAPVTVRKNGSPVMEWCFDGSPVDGIAVDRYVRDGLPTIKRVLIMRFSDAPDYAYVRYSYREDGCWGYYEVMVDQDGREVATVCDVKISC